MSSPHRALSPAQTRQLREYVTAMVLNGHVTAEAAGLHPIDLYVLNLLDLDGQASPGELAERTALTTGAITKLVDRLVRAGLVERIADPADRRCVLLQIVDETATEAIGGDAALFTPFAARMDELIGSFSETDRAVLFEFLARATRELQRVTIELQHTGRTRRRGATPRSDPHPD